MKTTRNEDGSTSYTLTESEKVIIFSMVSYFFGRRVGYSRGRTSLAKEINKTGRPQP